MTQPTSFCCYSVPTVNNDTALNGAIMAQRWQEHSRRFGKPAIIKVNPKLVGATTSWLTGSGNEAEVKGNGGALIGEVWIAAASANGATS